MAKDRFFNKDLIPTFGDEFSNENSDEETVDTQIWDSVLIADLIEKVETLGLDLGKVKHPFFEKNIYLKKGRIAFQYTQDEIDEFKKCKKDIIYFTNKYVKIMQEHGVDYFKMYPYQEEMLKMYAGQRLSLVLGSRQIGKCHFFDTTILKTSKLDNSVKEKVEVYKLYFNNLKRKTIFDYLKYGLYYLHSKLEN